MVTLSRLLSWYRPDTAAIAAHLDAASAEQRAGEVLALDREQQARLFEAVADSAPMTLADLVPKDVAPMTAVPHAGRNSLPAFRRFAKVFCRPDAPRSPEAVAAGAYVELWGYNRNPPHVTAAVGPGYFIARAADHGELVLDYTHVPPRAPASWPEIRDNKSRLSRFVYYRTQDYLRKVSAHVCVGRATRGGKVMDNWFVLVRGS
jgi:hypothetical protein